MKDFTVKVIMGTAGEESVEIERWIKTKHIVCCSPFQFGVLAGKLSG